MHGASVADNTPYAVEIELMREFHWSWHELQNTPAEVVDMAIERLAAERHWRAEQHKMQKAMQK